MLKDKSRMLLFGALVLLVLVLMGGGSHGYSFHFFHGASILRWVLFGLLIWLLISRTGGCCRGSMHEEEMDLEEEEEGDNEAEGKSE